MQVVIAPAVQFPMDLCSASAIQPISFFPVVSQNSSTQKKIANLKSQIPSLAFHSEQHANAQTTLPLYFLSGSSATLQCCRSRETPCQPSGSTRCPLNMTQGSQRKPSGVDQHQKHLVLKLHLYQRKCHNHRRQTTLAIIAIKTIELVSQPKLGLQKPPCSSIHLERYGMIALSQKGNTYTQVVFTQSPVSLTTTPEYLPVSGSNIPSLHLYQVSQTTAPIQRT